MFHLISSNVMKIFALVLSMTRSNLGYVGLKTRSLGQIIAKPFEHSRVQTFDPIFMKVHKNVRLDNV